jgi:predicted RNA-binding Zn-ribbon protein involved in translation (DUF1610 family)
MGEDWKTGFGSIGEIENFEQNGKSYLRKFSELFYFAYKVSQLVKKGHKTETLTKNLVKAFSDCRRTVKYYILGAVFFIDIDAKISLESLNRAYNVLLEMYDPSQNKTKGFIQLFLGYVYDELERDTSSQHAFQKAASLFPQGSRLSEFATRQLSGEISFKQWIAIFMTHFKVNDGQFLTNLVHVADSIDDTEFMDDLSNQEKDISIHEYEKKFLEERNKQKKKNTHVRRCPNCNYFMVAEGFGEKNCPQCHKSMNYALYCPTCGIWYTVKTPKKYMCPTCGNLMIKKEKI